MYLAAFGSLAVQIRGLVGANGVLPAREYLDGVAAALGPERYWWLPSLFWLHPTDGFLTALCASGVLVSLLLVVGVAPAASLAALWALYLSLTTIGQDFLSFQWDVLLLETGFLAIFLAPLGLRSSLAHDGEPRREAVWLLRWLVFRLMFSSGAVKLLSGDPTWRSLTALDYHYWTQPLPTWIAWYASHLPHALQAASCVVMFAIELVVPMLVWGGSRPRVAACGAFVALQLLIALTGNYGYFNLLTIALSLLLLDDDVWPARLRARREPGHAREWPRPIVRGVGAFLLFLSIAQTFSPARIGASWPDPVVAVRRAVAPLRLVGSYGLFAVMTTTRPELIVEGSDDGETWRPYEFRWKPGDVARAPSFVAPHQPRLDWQMWFAALGTYERSPWMLSFLDRLLRGSADVSALLARNPFPDHPPTLVRVVRYEYRFTTSEERRASGAWWVRQEAGLFLPALSIESLRRGG